MAKQIETLVEDIYSLLGGGLKVDGEGDFSLPDKLADDFGNRMARLVGYRIISPTEREPRLSPSNIGKPCERQVWLTLNRPEQVEPIDAHTKAKFLFGDIIEELLIFLAEASGHEVTGRQDQVEIEGIVGNRDVIIDGMLVDVKSASTYSFQKFKTGDLRNNDPFGYVGQIQTYLEASQNDPLLKIKDRCAFLVMDKTLGHVCLDIHPKVDFDVRAITRRKIAMVNNKDDMPPRRWEPIPDGKSGNEKLGMECSYCSVKKACHPNLRTFIYSTGPVFLTKVERLPSTPEVV